MKQISTFLLILICASANAQIIDDVLRYSTENIQGTARFQAMSGAFGALGGDLSALHTNPASSAVFSHSQLAITGAYYGRENETLFGNNRQTTTDDTVELNQVGGVFVFKAASEDSPWKKVALAFNYDVVQNFDNTVFAAGSTSQGIDNYFLNFANSEPLGLLRRQPGVSLADTYLDLGAGLDFPTGTSLGFATQQAFLGFQAGIIAPDDINNDANTAYSSNAQYSTVDQEYLQNTSGYNSKFTLNLAGQYEDYLYLGGSLNFHTILYNQTTFLDESGYDGASLLQETTFDNFLRTEGHGFSVSVGGIAKLNDNLRIGISYQSPTWYELRDDTSQRISSNLAEPDIGDIDFDVINFFEEYRIKTPSKLTGSTALVFGKLGLLSFDYSYQDMSKAELRPTTDPNFAAENEFIADQLGVVHTFRTGGEIRIKDLSLRGGYRFEGSPYENEDIIGNLSGFSGGIGYDFGGSRLDLAFSRTEQEVATFFFNSLIDANTGLDNISTNIINTNVTMSYTLKL